MSNFLAAAILACAAPIAPSKEFPADACWKVVAATFRVAVLTKGGDRHGTAFAIGSKGRVFQLLTAAHVVTGVQEVLLDSFDKAGFPVPKLKGLKARVLARDVKTDLALLGMELDEDVPEGSRPRVLELAGMDDLDPRKDRFPVLSVGCPDGGWPMCRLEGTTGKKLVVGKNDHSSFFWQTLQNGAPGRSGGPLVDAQGRAVGVCSAKQTGFSYYVHTDEIESFLKKNGFVWRSGKNSINIPLR